MVQACWSYSEAETAVAELLQALVEARELAAVPAAGRIARQRGRLLALAESELVYRLLTILLTGESLTVVLNLRQCRRRLVDA